ncbi:hypothetical protein UC34_11615 [Pandoraea vervacti]|uniref:DUF2169 domain-containing protein n=1 Tax=Pandoraea vervacti TaxID=656178 RepID=A0ABM5SY54_9BURK|nr:hypothetical protein [Pandoraea vervacti]AJP57496.1 hypothetical protein UC34_11615 [Pandoraea vervacti]
MSTSNDGNNPKGSPDAGSSNTFELFAKPMPKTSMGAEGAFVFGPTGGGVRGILIEARALPGGEPMEGIPCSIVSLTPDDAITSGAMGMPIGEPRFTDANGVAEFPVTYRQDAGLFSPARFMIAGGPTTKQYTVYYMRCPSDPDEATYMAVVYPARPELGEAYAHNHVRIYGIAARYAHGAAGVPTDPDTQVSVRLYRRDGSVIFAFSAPMYFSQSDGSISFRHDETLRGDDTAYDLGSMDAYVMPPLNVRYHIGGPDIDVKNNHPPLIEKSMAPFLYAPVKSAPVGEPIYLQWPTYANQQPGEKYRLTDGSGLDVEILPFTFGEVALARLTSSRAWSPNVYLYREVDGVEKFIDAVLLSWT